MLSATLNEVYPCRIQVVRYGPNPAHPLDENWAGIRAIKPPIFSSSTSNTPPTNLRYEDLAGTPIVKGGEYRMNFMLSLCHSGILLLLLFLHRLTYMVCGKPMLIERKTLYSISLD